MLTSDPVLTSLGAPDTFYRSANKPVRDNPFVTAMEQADGRLGVSPSVPGHAGTAEVAVDAGGDATVAKLREKTSVGVADGLTWIDVVTG